MKNIGEPCILEARSCTQCGECDYCELNPEKLCDNCCNCIESPKADYLGIEIDDILIDTEDISDSH
ncbi:MAG: hypothetical protein M0T74_11765 [Desulfitobacterium hafniense]|nr:hypothetical protein [Desulfitobacterium hafniense]